MPKGAEKFIQDTVRKAGKETLRLFRKTGVKYMKSEYAWDCVTEADILSDKIIRNAIEKKYPTHGIIAEESGTTKSDAEYVWVADPIDGTLNYSRGIPMYGVMLCLMHKEKVILSAVFLPATGELFFASAGKGAYLNGKRIHCSRKKDLHHSLGTGNSSLYGKTALFLKRLLRDGQNYHIQLGTLGSIAANACYVACGRRDWMVPFSGKDWDFAPVLLILKESGCKVTDTKGGEWKLGIQGFVAANSSLHRQLLPLTKGI
jgi:myo-inositol-1(or 4)-monophosphatase